MIQLNNGNNLIGTMLRAASLCGILTLATNPGAFAEPTVDILLPSSPDYAPDSRASVLLTDPFNSGPATGVLVGLWGSSTPGSVLRLTPVDAESSSFNLQEVDGGIRSVYGLAYNQNEGIYAGGFSSEQYTRRDSTTVWTVRRSAYADHGNPGTWKDDDRFYFKLVSKGKLVAVYQSNCQAVAADHAGTMFATGTAYNGSSWRWITRRKLAGGLWTTVLDRANSHVNSNPGFCTFAGNATYAPAVFAVGDEGYRWAVYRSQQQGAANTWVRVDDWPDGPVQSAAVDVVADAAGNIYVAGYRGVNGTNPSSWTVRRSSDAGTTWTTVLDVQGHSVTAAVSLSIDQTGALAVSGTVTPDGTTSLWKVIRCTDPTSTDPATMEAAWTGAFQNGVFPFGNVYSKGSGVVADPTGSLFVGGRVRDWTDESGTYYSGSRAGLVKINP